LAEAFSIFAESLCFFMRMAMGFLIFAWQVVILDLMCMKSHISCEKHKRHHRTIPALRLKHRSGGCGTASAPPKMLDNAQSIICAFGLASAAPRSPYWHLELCGIAIKIKSRPLLLAGGDIKKGHGGGSVLAPDGL